jgi:mono/diheme cytochrome c family protein
MAEDKTILRRALALVAAIHLSAIAGVSLTAAQAPTGVQKPPALPTSRTGEDIFRATCATCHALDGKGSPRSVVGFDTPLPDFTDCSFATAESHTDWRTVVHEGGPIRALDRHMPAFGDALTKDDIAKVVTYVKSLLREQVLAARRPEFSASLFHGEGVSRERDRVRDIGLRHSRQGNRTGR